MKRCTRRDTQCLIQSERELYSNERVKESRDERSESLVLFPVLTFCASAWESVSKPFRNDSDEKSKDLNLEILIRRSRKIHPTETIE